MVKTQRCDRTPNIVSYSRSGLIFYYKVIDFGTTGKLVSILSCCSGIHNTQTHVKKLSRA